MATTTTILVRTHLNDQDISKLKDIGRKQRPRLTLTYMATKAIRDTYLTPANGKKK